MSDIPESEQPIAVHDDIPGIKEQAHLQGWTCDYFSFGKGEQAGVDLFNPGLVRRPDGLWLIARRSEAMPGMPFGKNGIWACKLNEDRTPVGGPRLKFPNSGPDEQFEDPRAVYWNGQTWVACVNFTWYADNRWTGAHCMLGVFADKSDGVPNEASWTPIARRDPVIGTNKGIAGHVDGKHNKNLLYWFRDDKLLCLYLSDPWTVVEFGSKWSEQTPYVSGDGLKWPFGVIRGGTPPVLVDDYYISFFHSSLPWKDKYRRYYMGAVAFDKDPPFTPRLWTQKPILAGSQHDPWKEKKPLVVFPCGAVLENGKWLVTFGVNDLKSAWIEIPHSELFPSLKSAPVIPGISLLSDNTVKPVEELEPYGDGLQPADVDKEQFWTPQRKFEFTVDKSVRMTPEPVASAPVDAKRQAALERLARGREIMRQKRAAGTLASPKPRKKKRRRKRRTA